MYKTETSDIKNKQKRVEVHYKRNIVKNMLKMKERKERKKLPACERQTPITIEDKQRGGEEYVEEYDEGLFD